MRLRRSSKLMYYDPLTIIVAPTAGGKAQGSIYLDDEHTLAHETTSAFIHRKLTFENNVLTCSAAFLSTNSGTAGSGIVLSSSGSRFRPPNTIERVEIAGQDKVPKRIVLRVKGQEQNKQGEELVGMCDTVRKVITVKKPDCFVADDWTITFEF